MPIKKPAPDAIKKRDHAQSMPACSPRSKAILGLDNQHGIYRNPSEPSWMGCDSAFIPSRGIGSNGSPCRLLPVNIRCDWLDGMMLFPD